MPDLKEGVYVSKERPPIPADLKRQIRRKSFYGCVLCGNPIIEYHHIKDWCIVKEHTADNLVALCPTCHYRATIGELTPERVTRLKMNPYNSKLKTVSKNFFMNHHEASTIKLGSVKIKASGTILRVHNDSIISLRLDDEGNTLLSLKIHDENHNLIAQVIDNEWIANITDQIWDITFNKGVLDIRCSSHKVWLKVITTSDTLELEGKTYFDNGLINFNRKDGLKINNSSCQTYIKNSDFVIPDYPDDVPVIQIGRTLLNTGAIFYYE